MGWPAWNRVKWKRVLIAKAQIFNTCFTTFSSGKYTLQSKAQNYLNKLIYLSSTTWGHKGTSSYPSCTIDGSVWGCTLFWSKANYSLYITELWKQVAQGSLPQSSLDRCRHALNHSTVLKRCWLLCCFKSVWNQDGSVWVYPSVYLVFSWNILLEAFLLITCCPCPTQKSSQLPV